MNKIIMIQKSKKSFQYFPIFYAILQKTQHFRQITTFYTVLQLIATFHEISQHFATFPDTFWHNFTTKHDIVTNYGKSQHFTTFYTTFYNKPHFLTFNDKSQHFTILFQTWLWVEIFSPENPWNGEKSWFMAWKSEYLGVSEIFFP